MAARQKKVRAGKPQERRGTPARPPKTGIGMLLRDADSAFNRYLTAQLAVHGVTFGQFQHLRNLWVEDGLTQAELVAPHRHRDGVVDRDPRLARGGESSSPACAMPPTVARSTSFLTPAGAALEKALMACAADANKRASKASAKPRSLTCSRWPGRSSRTSGRLRAAGASSAKADAPLAQKLRPSDSAARTGASEHRRGRRSRRH